MNARTSRDLDIWRPASDYDFLELKRAVEAAGLAFDPKSSVEPDVPYVQLIEPGPTQLGDFRPVLMERMGRLEIYRPPIENLIAAKLIRADARDVEDVVFLAGKYRPTMHAVRLVAESFVNPGRRQALEKLVFLRVVTDDDTHPPTTDQSS